MSKVIKLTKGKEAIVDDEDYEFLSGWRWKYHKDNYAVRNAGKNGNIYMHRLINKTPKGLVTDHINRNGLDNRRCNLRTCTISENAFNTKLPSDNTSGYKGVTWHKLRQKWQAQVNMNKKIIYLGCFKNIKDAISSRLNWEKQNIYER